MSDRYQGYVPTVSSRTSTYTPARTSAPTSMGYSSMYAGDMHVVPSASHGHHVTPRSSSTSTNAAGVPTTTRTYTVTNDPRAVAKTRDSSRPRRSTLDSSSSRPPVIITTTQLERPHVSSSSSHASSGRSRSPIRDDFRTSDGQVFSQPASSVRSRSSTRSYHVANSHANPGRYRERGDGHLSSHDLEAYRSSRPYVTYPSDPKHSTAAIDYGDDGYQYTNAGELVKYDLDQSKSGRPSRRRDSMDAGYYRPNINHDTDRRNLNVNTSHDLIRPPNGQNRQTDGRGGPPPSTRGFDKINRGYDARDAPPVVPASPLSTLAVPPFGRRPRPLSLHQEDGLRSSHHDEYYRSREDERHMRDLRDRDRDRDRNRDRDRDRDYERRPEPSRYQDDGVVSRGFGIRADLPGPPAEARDRRRDTRLDEPRKRSDEELAYGTDIDKDSRHRRRPSPADDPRGSRQNGRVASDENQDRSDRSRVRDSLATSLGAVATAIGLAAPAVFKSQDKRDLKPQLPPRRRSPPEERDTRKEDYKEASRVQVTRGREPSLSQERPWEPVREKESTRDKAPLMIREKDLAQERDPLRELFRDKEPVREREPVRDREYAWEREPTREREPVRDRDFIRDREPIRDREYTRERERAKEDGAAFNDVVRRRPYTDARTSGQTARQSGSDSDDTKISGRKQSSSTFDPNDASDLKQLKDQLASMDAADGCWERDTERSGAAAKEKTRGRSPSTSRDRASHGPARGSSGDEPRGRELVVPASDGKQVRVVSPPREKPDGKPLRGILKQPKASFPEDDNPIREGVTPHKEDKKLKEVPPGARWTKINRKIVNPEALTVGKERFEARDDFVIVLRVLSKEEIQAYAAATQVLRERRRNKHDGDRDQERVADRDRSVDKGDDDDDDDDDDGEDAERRRRYRRRRDGEEADEEEYRERQREPERDRKRDDDRR